MSLVNFTNLDFDQIKLSIKDYLRSNSNFTDYDFEGSNLSMIIDVLAYNTYITSYNANMITNEVFIDSATLRENVIALARNIGYVPRSKTSSRAKINFFVDVTATPKSLSLTLQKGICCTSNSFGKENYIFSILENITVPVKNGIASFDNVEIIEGVNAIETFNVSSLNPNQRYILLNNNIDTSTIRVIVTEDGRGVKYSLATNILDANSGSKIFFIQEVEDQKYELIFGDGVFGKKLENNSIIQVSYLISTGSSGNGISDFRYSGRIVDNITSVITNGISLISPVSSSQGGGEIESISSIKNYAPRLYSSQNRAVTASDYEAIIPQIYPEAESVSVFGGEDMKPPKYGKVFITIKPFYGDFLPNSIKDNIKNKLKKYSVAGIVPEILDLKYLHLEIESNVYYNTNLAPGSEYIRDIVSKNITLYADSKELNRYGARFKYSKYQKIVDDTHESITSNITNLQMRRDLKPLLNTFAEYEICFGNAFHINNENGYNIKTSGFRIDGVANPVYISDIPNINKKTGRMILFTLDSESQPNILKKSVGTIDYVKGEILISLLYVVSTEKTRGGVDIIEISASPKSNDVIGLQDLYLQLDINNVAVNVLPDEISSGSDVSGSNYIVSSSYDNGNLVRK
jgi:hypothetical protein